MAKSAANSSEPMSTVTAETTASNNASTIASLPIKHDMWIAFVVVEVILLSGCLYLLATVFCYFITRYSKQGPRGRKPLKRSKLIMDGCFVFYCIAGVAMSAFNLVVMLAPHVTKNCVRQELSIQLIHAICLCSLNLFLWIRQNSLYREPILRTLATPCLVRLNWTLLGFIIATTIAGVSLLVAVITDERHVISNFAAVCRHANRAAPNILIVFGYAVVVLIQAPLLFLFVRILRSHVSQMTNLGDGTPVDSCRRIRILVRNCCVAATVTLLTDLVIMTFDAITGEKILTQHEIYVLMDIDHAVNLVCTLFCFKNWSKMIWPWHRRPWRRTSKDPTRSTALLREKNRADSHETAQEALPIRV